MSATITVTNPATDEVCGEVADHDAADLDATVAGAQAALADWAADDARRAAALVSGAKALLAEAQELAALLTAEQGKPLSEAVAEVQGTAGWLLYYGRLELAREELARRGQVYAEVRRVPVGVVAAITPWNFPLMLAAFKIAPALRAGATMVLKPSSLTPLATLAVVEILNRELPPGVLTVLTGAGALGAAMAAHPGMRKVSFTGSTATGRAIAAAAVPELKRLTLELGGNDPAIVLEGADPASVGSRLYDLAFTNAGQVCCTLKRVYVPRALQAELVDVLAARAGSAVVGDGAADGTQMGPVNNPAQRDFVAGLVDAARAGGARLAVGGGALDGPGSFYAPTILADVADTAAIVQEEQFGPALPVIPYDDLDTALAMANGTPFGLSGSVWGPDPDTARAVAARLQCGTAWVNDHTDIRPEAPFSGWKHSGVGVENGIRGLEAFCELQVLHRGS